MPYYLSGDHQGLLQHFMPCCDTLLGCNLQLRVKAISWINVCVKVLLSPPANSSVAYWSQLLFQFIILAAQNRWFFPWKLWDTVLKQFSNIDLERVPISFCFLSLCCLNTCKITSNNSAFDSLKNRGLEIGWSFISKDAFLANPVMMEICVFK